MNMKNIFLLLSLALFFFNPAHAATGTETAGSFNQRFSDTSPDCEGEAAYVCSGIVLRSNEGKPYTWTVSQNSLEKEKFSTSFIRADISDGANSVFRNHRIGFGIILYPSNQKQYYTRCIFPINGLTSYNSEHGCGAPMVTPKTDEDNSTCSAAGILTAEQWMAASTEEYDVPCSFSTHSALQFIEALKTQNLYHLKYPDSHDAPMWNELIVNASPDDWDNSLAANGLIQALYYNKYADGDNGQYPLFGLSGAQSEQLAYKELTGSWLPIVAVDDTSPDTPFSYADSDQAVLP
ncbi:hypothetical protein [Enterobacter kobei]|uniref:hypothetical protein n=1 Tax=Enterobacter kobei TaxID=208224 RepID=UPI003CF792CD